MGNDNNKNGQGVGIMLLKQSKGLFTLTSRKWDRFLSACYIPRLTKRCVALAWLALMLFPSLTFAESLTCTERVSFAGVDTQIQLTITPPQEIDAALTLAKGRRKIDVASVGVGEITIREVTGEHVENRKSDLYVTTVDTGIMTGFFVEGALVYVLRFSPEAKEFSYFDSFRERLVSGTCG